MLQAIPFTIREFDPAGALVKVARTIYHWLDRAEQRHRLGELDQRALADIGVSRGQALSEARKPFWWN